MLSGQYPPSRGGIGDYTQHLVNALIEAGEDVKLIVPSGSDLSHTTAPLVGTISEWGWALLPKIKDLLDATSATWLHIQFQINIYHQHSAICFLPTFLRLLGWKGRVAVTFHDLQKPYLFPKAGVLRRQMIEFMGRSATICLAADNGDVQTLKEMHAQVRQIPIGSNISIRDDMAEISLRKFRNQLSIPNNALLIGHFGTVAGLETLAHTLTELPEAFLLLIGKREQKGDDDFVPVNEFVPHLVYRDMKRLGILHRTRWTGYLEANEVGLALAVADIIVFPYPEGISLRHGGLMAALAQGAIIITTNPQIPPSYLIDGVHFLSVPAGDQAALSKMILRVVSDSDLRTRLSINAKYINKEKFSWSAIAQSHLELYNSI